MKTTPDWESIERDYRTAPLSVRQIARAHGITHTAITKRAAKGSWKRDLSVHASTIKIVADRIVKAERSLAALPISAQVIAQKLAARQLIEIQQRDVWRKIREEEQGQ